jgi:hypothetical protein
MKYLNELTRWDQLRRAGQLVCSVEFPVTINRIMSDLRIHPTKAKQVSLGHCLRMLSWRRLAEDRKTWDRVERWIAPD